jgi:hypothetical protein
VSMVRWIRPPGKNFQPPVRAEVEVSDLEVETGGRMAPNFPDLRVSAARPETADAANAAAIGVIRAGAWRFGVFGKWNGTQLWDRTTNIQCVTCL